MTETNLRKNYKLLAISEKKIEPVVAPAMDATPVSEPATEPLAAKVEEQPAEKSGRAAGVRVMLKDGSIVAGSKFITETCQQS